MDEQTEAELLIDKTDGVLVLTLDRPARKNALSPEMYDDLLTALVEAEDDPTVGAIVLTGSGGTFSAGGDVKRMAGGEKNLSFDQRATRLRKRARISEMLHEMGKPTIAMMRGHAVGAGLSIALACDLRLADTSIRLLTGFVKVGLPGDFGGHYFLPRLVGMAKARELYLTSPTIEADEALSIGLVNRVFAPDQLEDEVRRLAQGLAKGPRTSTAYIKRNLNLGLELSLSQMLDAESFHHARCGESRDHKEAVQAFVERRSPIFNVSED